MSEERRSDSTQDLPSPQEHPSSGARPGSRGGALPSRFKESLRGLESAIAREHAGYRRALRTGVVLSVAVHVVALLIVLPRITGRIDASTHPTVELVVLPPAADAYAPTPPVLELPEPPRQLARPAIPKAVPVDEPEWIPPFIPHDTPPKLVNAPKVIEILQERYPAELKEQGASGIVLLWVFVDETGMPVKLQLRRSSGYDELDRAAQSVGEEMRFRPALNHDRPVGVWVAQQIRFRFEGLEQPQEIEASSASG